MQDWKTWCRLCGNYEVSERIEPEIKKIAEQFSIITSDNAFICLDCKGYLHYHNSFINKTRNITELFEQIEQFEERDEVSEEILLQLRLNYDLPIPESQYIVETDVELVSDLNEIESFRLDEEAAGSSQEEEVEYFVENIETESEIEAEILEEVQEDSKKSENLGVEEVQFEDEMIFQEVVDESSGTRIEEYNDDIANHFDFRCHICQEQFKKMYFLTTHTQTAHNCLPRVLCKCGRYIGSTKSLIDHYENHIEISANFRCVDCNKNYKTQNHYNNHMMTHHSQNAEGDSRKFMCECGKSFKEARHLAVHENSHLPSERKFVHLCTYCDRKYSSIFSLRHHIKHIHVKELNFQCQHCEKAFSRKANLDSHISHVHTSERKHECDICGLKVKTKSILRVHKKIHSTNPEDFLPCEVCQKEFKTQNQLINHMVCHSDLKKYKCGLCSAEYKRSKELSCHIASAHTHETIACAFCTRTFYSNSNYRKHKLKVHAAEMETYLVEMK